MPSKRIAPTAIVAVIAGAILAVAGSCGVYSAAQPTPLTGKSADYHYGVK
jgi:hypothetical protein